MSRILATTGLFAVLLCAAPAPATTVIEKNLADLCNEADMIFVGKVVSVESRWREPERKSIETAVRFAVMEPVYGVEGSDVVLTFSGGEVDGLREVVAGLPQFAPGEEALIFATNQRLVSPVVGFHQGCFRVAEEGGRAVVLNAEREPLTSVQGRSLFFGKQEDGPRGAVPLDRFIDTVRQQLEKRGTPGTP